MKPLIAASALLASLSACAADSLSARVEQAKAVEESSAGRAYQKELWAAVGPQTGKLMHTCFPDESAADARAFTLVGTVQAGGKLEQVLVEPGTPMTKCFATGFAELTFPSPPASFQESGMPLVVEMKITK